jgi:hypothetical protein
VPDPTGALRCTDMPDGGGPVCRQPGQSCTINADCCSGYICVTPTGSTVGTCGTPPPPTYDAGPPPVYDGGLGCSAYGQVCSASTPCCNNVSCLGTNGAVCTPDTTCRCYTIVN